MDILIVIGLIMVVMYIVTKDYTTRCLWCGTKQDVILVGPAEEKVPLCLNCYEEIEDEYLLKEAGLG